MSGAGAMAVPGSPGIAAVEAQERTAMDEAAFRELYTRTARPLWGYLARSTGSDTLPLEHSPAVEGPGHRVRLRRDVQRLLEKLKPRERELLWLGHVEQFSHQEIAEILGLKPGSIRLLLFRARRKLASLLTEADLGPEMLR